jgi:hypothetical protein
MTAGEVQADAGEEFTDAPADLEEAQAQGVELERWVALGAEPAAEGVEEPVGSGVQEPAELVGPEAMVTQAVGDAGALVVFDPALHLATIDVPIIERLGWVGPGGDDKAGVGPLVQGLGFVDDPARVVPTLRLLLGLRHQADFLPRLGALRFGLRQQGGSQRLEPGIG